MLPSTQIKPNLTHPKVIQKQRQKHPPLEDGFISRPGTLSERAVLKGQKCRHTIPTTTTVSAARKLHRVQSKFLQNLKNVQKSSTYVKITF